MGPTGAADHGPGQPITASPGVPMRTTTPATVPPRPFGEPDWELHAAAPGGRRARSRAAAPSTGAHLPEGAGA